MNKCPNCKKQTTGKLCDKCKEAARKLDKQDDEKVLERLEQKPRTWREAWEVRK